MAKKKKAASTKAPTSPEISFVESSIIVVRDKRVILDSDLAEFYGVETRQLNQQVKRNAERFGERYAFQLTKEEFDSLRSQSATSNALRSQSVTSNALRQIDERSISPMSGKWSTLHQNHT